MTAGSGILHQEFHEKEFSKKGGTFQMVQLWVNLPAKDKETTPKYQDLLKSEMTMVPIENQDGYVHVVVGNYQGNQGKGTTFSPIELYNAYINEGGKAEFSFPVDYNTALLVINGEIKVNGQDIVGKDSFVLFENDQSPTFSLEGLEKDTKVLIMSGEPLNEPVAHYGPFVMNTQAQLIQAFKDFEAGKFGVL